jgi:hypothetical protein
VLGGAFSLPATTKNRRSSKSHSVLPNLGNPTPLHLKYAEQLRDALPESVKAAAREPLDAVALIYAMLLSRRTGARDAQLAEIRHAFRRIRFRKNRRAVSRRSKAAAHAHLPIINLALGALRQLTRTSSKQFSQTLQWLIESDGKVELFEFVCKKLSCTISARNSTGPAAVVQYYSIKPLVPDCAVVLSALANVGSDDAAEIQKAFDDRHAVSARAGRWPMNCCRANNAA